VWQAVLNFQPITFVAFAFLKNNAPQPEDAIVVGRIEDDPIVDQLPERPRFIPLRHADLKEELIQSLDLDSFERDHFLRFSRRVQAVFHTEHHAALLRLEEIYELLDPDSQLVSIDAIQDDDRSDIGDQLIDKVSGLLFAAHYKRLTRKEIERAIDVGWQWGVKLEVDFDIFERLEIFARGYRKVTFRRRRWQKLFRLETIELPEFTRLIMVLRVKPPPEDRKKTKLSLDSRFVYLKTFKDIPETEVEILLPGSKIRLTKLDRAKILFPTLSGMAITIYKITRSAVLLSMLSLSVALSFDKIIGLVVLVGGTIGYIVKSVMSYFRTKNDYEYGLTKNLYVKNLDNNLGVLYRILNEAEEQEVSETLLAYAILWRHPSFQTRGASYRELDDAVEAFIDSAIESAAEKPEEHEDCTRENDSVDFEVHDALGKLARLGLASVDESGYWKAEPIEDAIQTLASHWDTLLP
jgi:hypothetical protein